ncbi:MAG: glycosyltransferase family 2 protein, partial [Bifidobacteriaceae bacterium]|nr:glycosyltransferase family 2 protein [Bifidobacteriaceae bacterium]
MSLTDTGSLRRARTPVTAVVVTRGRSPFLPRALVALAEQTRRPERVVLVDAGEQEDPAIREMAIRCGIPDASLVNVQARWSRSFGRAVAAGLREAELAEDELVFLLHDDSYPRYDCLEKLARAVEFAPSVVIAGPKQLRADRPEALGQVGVTTSRFGRRMTGAEDGELDQGQYDHREDMLGVGAAGMLVRADAWRELGGIDPSLGPFRDGLNLSRRARLAGYRVIVVPQAVVYHEQASFRGLRGKADAPDVRRSFLARRRAFVYSELVQVHPLLVPLALAAAVVSGIARAAWRMASKDLDLAPAELIAPFEVLARPERIWAGRRLARGSARLSRRTIHPLQTTSREVRAMHRDRRLARAEEVRVREAPSEVELAERAALAKRRRRVLGVVAGFALLVSVIALGGLAGGGRIAGGALAQLTVSAGQAWDRAFGSWIDQGLGHAGPADPMAAVLALAQTLGLGHGTALLMLACPLGAALGAWFAAGAAARSVAVRAWVALVWFAAPPLWLALASGRLGAAVTHAALPWALLALARAAGVDRRDVIRREVPHSGEADDAGSPAPAAGPPSVTAAAAAGLALALAAAGTPGLLPLVLLGLLLVGVTTRVRWRLAFAALPPLALFAPLIAHAVRTGSWRALLADPGLPLASAPAPVWRALLGWPADPVVPEGFGVGVGALMFFSAFTVVAALAALARRGPRSRAVRVGWAVALAGLFGAAAAARIDVGESAEAFIRPWAGGAVSLVLAGLLLAAAAGADGAGSWFDVVGGSHRIEAGVLAGVMLL